MTTIDPIIAVKDVEVSSKWYEQIFGFRNAHGGQNFAVLLSENEEIILCLHQWGEHQHPTMTDREVVAGNGLILYFRTDNLSSIREKVEAAGWTVEEEIHLNVNSLREEFSLRDPDGYFLTITEFHRYEG